MCGICFIIVLLIRWFSRTKSNVFENKPTVGKLEKGGSMVVAGGINVTLAVTVILLVLLSAHIERFSGLMYAGWYCSIWCLTFFSDPYWSWSLLEIYKYCNITTVIFIYVLRYFHNFTFYLFVDVATIELFNIFV